MIVVCVYAYIQTNVYAYICIQVYTHVYIHTRIYIQILHYIGFTSTYKHVFVSDRRTLSPTRQQNGVLSHAPMPTRRCAGKGVGLSQQVFQTLLHIIYRHIGRPAVGLCTKSFAKTRWQVNRQAKRRVFAIDSVQDAAPGTHVCMYIVRTHVYVSLRTYACMYLVRKFVCVYVYSTYIYMRVCMHANAYVHTDVCMHACVRV